MLYRDEVAYNVNMIQMQRIANNVPQIILAILTIRWMQCKHNEQVQNTKQYKKIANNVPLELLTKRYIQNIWKRFVFLIYSWTLRNVVLLV